MNRNALPPSLVANLQQVLISRKNTPRQEDNEEEKVVTESTELTQSTIDGAAQDPSSSSSSSISSSAEDDSEEKSSKPVILVTNGDGIESPGLVSLVDALVRDGRFDVHVCAPQLLVRFHITCPSFSLVFFWVCNCFLRKKYTNFDV